MRAYGGVKVQLYAALISAQDGGVRVTSRSPYLWGQNPLSGELEAWGVPAPGWKL